MGNLRRWSTTATGNATVSGGVNTINFAEGQTPGSVNNSAREMMAQVRGIYNPSDWGWVENSATASVASQTTFKLAGNQTTDWVAPRRFRLKSGSSTRYGSVVSSSFTVETTITCAIDSGSLSASHSLAALSLLDNVSNHLPAIRTDASGNIGIGTPSGTLNGKLVISNAGASGLEVQPNYPGGGPGTSILSYNRSGAAYINSAIDGLSHTVRTSGFDRFKIDSSGNALIISAGALGYGTGSGGTVTQITSRATSVTLNKTNGTITMFTAVGSTTPAFFQVVNSTVAATDTVILSQQSGTNLYNFVVTGVGAGAFNITYYTTGGTASDAPVINFAVIKAVTA